MRTLRLSAGMPLRRLFLTGIPILLILSACGSSSREATATHEAEAVFTAAYQTLSAQAATQLALTPSSAPTRILSATPPSLMVPTASVGSTFSPGSQSACDNSTYISDVTIPDGTVIAAGAKFVKTWLLQNNGTCAWSTSYKLAFVGGDQMGGASLFVANTIQPGQQVPLSVNLIAPSTPGTYKGTWRMQNSSGQAFGDYPYVEISVGAAAACHRSSRTEVTISGDAGPENVTIDYGDGVVTTDPKGKYSFTVPAGWSGTVTPSKAKVNPWTFSPAQRTYSNVTCDLSGENYIATAPPGV